jgi:CheY-like chemotaxis protein
MTLPSQPPAVATQHLLVGLGDNDMPSAASSADGQDAQVDQELGRWHELLAQVGRQLAEPLTAALERVTTLSTTGRIDRAGLRALRDEVDRARQAGIWAQQISRLASGRVRQSHERVHLTNTVQSVLAYRARELHGKGIALTQSLQAVEVQVDASMLFSLLNAMVDWWLDAAQGMVDLRIDTRTWPVQARLNCRFQHHPLDQTATPQAAEGIQASLTTMHWHLLEQTARSLGLNVERLIDTTHAQLTLSFPQTVQALMAQVEPDAPDHGFADSVNSKPLAGSHVLVVAGRRDLRVQLREATKDMGLVVDFVGSVREAAEFCREGLPHAIVFEGALRNLAFEQLAAGIRQEVPEFVFIELGDEGQRFEISTISPTGMARVGRDAIASTLPSALVYELSRVM